MSGRYQAWHPPRTAERARSALLADRPGLLGGTGDTPSYLPASTHTERTICDRGLRLTPIALAASNYCKDAAPATASPKSTTHASQQWSEVADWVDPDDDGEVDCSDEIGPSASDDASRSKLLARAITVLIAERQRSGEPLRQESIERVYAQLKLTPDEMLRVGREARLIGLMDAEEPEELDELVEDSDDDEQGEARCGLLDRILSHELLGAERERQLGRAIQVAKKLDGQLANNLISSSRDLERELARGRQARHALVLANARLAMDIARRHAHGGLELDDLLQEGVIGLLRAAESYDPDLGFRFTTYATWWIRQSILRAAANTGRQIRLPVYRVEQLKELRRTVRRLQAKNPQARITPKQIADELGSTLESVGRLLVLDAESFTSLHPTEDDGPSVLDQLVSPEPTPEATAITFDFERFISECVAALPERDADVLRSRFGLLGRPTQTLEEIGKQYKLTRERIRQIESKGLRQLRRPSCRMMEYGREFLND